jgi:hypothetical protein
MLFPGTVAARFLCAACCSEAGLIGARVGADIGIGVEGEGSGKDSVAIWGNSLSIKKLRDSPVEPLGFEREDGMEGKSSRRSPDPSEPKAGVNVS